MSAEFNTDIIKFSSIAIRNATVDNNTDLHKIDKSSYNHDIKFDFTPAISTKEERVRINFSAEIETFKILEDGREKIDINSKFEIEYYYKIDDFEKYVFRDENKIDSQLLVVLSSLAYSTSRGIIFAKCQGTILSDMVIPVVSNNKLVDYLVGNTDE